MPTKRHLPYILLLFLLTACSGQPSQEPFVTQTLAPTPEFIRFTSTPQTIVVTPTHTRIPTATARILPTLSPTLVDMKSLPKLREVIISSIDSENIEALWYYSPITQVIDATNELQGICLWDCAKYRYSLEHGVLTITLLRAGDPPKAESTVESLKKGFLKTVRHYEYTASDIPDMPSGSWVIVDAPTNTEDHEIGAAGIAYGSVAILVTYDQIWSDNLMALADPPVEFLNAQIQKLEAAGYPK